MKIRIKSREFDVQRGTSKKSGQAYELRKQTAFLEVNDEVRRLYVVLGRDQEPYAPGIYVVGEESFTVNGFNELAIGRLVLVPAAPSVAKVG